MLYTTLSQLCIQLHASIPCMHVCFLYLFLRMCAGSLTPTLLVTRLIMYHIASLHSYICTHAYAHTHTHTHTHLSCPVFSHCPAQVIWPSKKGRDNNSKSRTPHHQGCMDVLAVVMVQLYGNQRTSVAKSSNSTLA